MYVLWITDLYHTSDKSLCYCCLVTFLFDTSYVFSLTEIETEAAAEALEAFSF